MLAGKLDFAAFNAARQLSPFKTPKAHHHVLFRLAGSKSKCIEIGARVTVLVGAMQQADEVHGRGGCNSSYDTWLHFGLGRSATIDKCEVRWPSGLKQEFLNLPAVTIHEINEEQELRKLMPPWRPLSSQLAMKVQSMLVYNGGLDMCGKHPRPGLILIVAIAFAILSLSRLDCQENSPQTLYDQAGRALDAKDTATAIRLYEELLKQVPDSIDARINLGVALAQQGNYNQAARQYRAVLSRDPRNETAILNLSLAMYKQGDFSTARDGFDELHKLRPDNQQAFYLLADCSLRLGNFKDVIALVEPAYDAHPDDQAVDYILGTALIQGGQTQKGAAVIDRIMRNGNPAVASVLVGSTQSAAGDYKTAAVTLKKALDQNPDIPGAWTLYGQALLNNGENEKGKEALRRAIQADPNDFDACLHLGAVLRHDGDTVGARPYLEHSVTLRPDSATAQFQILALDAETGHLEEAKIGFQKLVIQWPDFVNAHLQLAMVYSRLHQTEDSERERQIVVKLNEKARTKGPQPADVP